MRDLSKEILYYSNKFSSDCPQYEGEKTCKREGGCVCAKYGEIYALIHSLIKPEYRKSNFYDFTGKLSDDAKTKVVSNASDIRKKLWTYLYGDADIKAGLDRKHLNQLSVLDKRFVDGSSLIIHGDSQHTEKDGGFYVRRHVPMGKTLLASIVMVDAIYRRAYPTNRAMTYDWISFLQLRQMLKQKENDQLSETQEADWLVIDDLDLIEKGDHSRSNAWTKEMFDSFLIERIEQRRPTILVCNFDATKTNLDEKMGAAFAKIVSSSNTHMLKVNGVAAT
jgi:hypothetical protein